MSFEQGVARAHIKNYKWQLEGIPMKKGADWKLEIFKRVERIALYCFYSAPFYVQREL